jgi:N-acetylglucosaminyldiphosphoundecaprenol N-acetyl-beta-D-mannosaminyltransferase
VTAANAGLASTPEARSLVPDRRTELLGAPLDCVDYETAVAAIEDRIARRAPCQHMSLNAAKLVKLQNDDLLAAAVRRCELVTADGQAVVWAGRLLGTVVPERVAGIDLMHKILGLAERQGYSVFLLGAREHVLRDASRRLAELYPRLDIRGAHHGYFSAEEEPEVVEAVVRAEPDMLLVALETPAKELFLARHRDKLEIPFVMGVGGAFDILAGVRRRAPRWMQRVGLEWLFRLLQDPRRMARRYLVGNVEFIRLVAREYLRHRPARTARSD